MEKKDDDPEDIEYSQFSVKGSKQWIDHGSQCEDHEQPQKSYIFPAV